MTSFDIGANVFVAGHNGMVGSAIVRMLDQRDFKSVFVADRNQLDLTELNAVTSFFVENKISVVYLAAARVGGIHANNTYPADFIRENLAIQLSVVEAAYQAGVDRLLFLGSSCIYPRLAGQPMVEDALLSGALEPTNEPYAVAKIAGIKLCESYNRQYGCDYRSIMPTNLYGTGDNFHPENSHVVPALLRRFHEAKLNNSPEVVVWGSGTPKREFLFVDDMAEACLHMMNIDKESYQQSISPMQSHINIGTGLDCTIRELAETIAKVVGYQGSIVWDASKPDGTPRKLLDVSLASSLGWSASTTLEAGLEATYQWFCTAILEKEIRYGN